MTDLYKKPYFDSSVFIAWIQGEVVKGVERAEIADHILGLAEHRGAFRIHTSALTLAEVHKPRARERLGEQQGQRILSYFEHDFIDIIDVDRVIGEHAHKLCLEYGIYPNDAVHLTCALRAGCDVLLAWDDRFAKVQHPNIRIEEPQIIGPRELPGMPAPSPRSRA